MAEQLTIPAEWDDVTPAWMTIALQRSHPGVVVDDVTLTLRDDGTNRRARFAIGYAEGTGPRSVFCKAESDVEGRREIHARNGNLFNEPKLFLSGVEPPLEHARAFASVVDEEALDYVVVFEDLAERGADPLDATRPLSVEQAADGLRSLARLHADHWASVTTDPRLGWLRPLEATTGWTKPLAAIAPMGIEKAGDAVPAVVRDLGGAGLVDDVWVRYVAGVNTGPPTLLHGDPHIGNTYRLPDGTLGFLDWQVMRRGSWAHDVGYFLLSALTVDDGRAHERDLLDEYLAALDVETPPSADEAWLRYRTTPAHGLPVWLVTLCSDVHAHERSSAMVERYADAFVRLDTPTAIAQVENPVS